MTVEELAEQIINETLPLLEISKVLGTNEAYSRGASLLTAQARLTNCWKTMADSLIQAKAEEETAWFACLTGAEGKSVGEREAGARASKRYQEANAQVETLKNNIAYVQSFMRQFENAYRLMTYMIKGEVAA